MFESRPDGACVCPASDNLCRINPVNLDKRRTLPSEWANPDSAEVCPELSRQ